MTDEQQGNTFEDVADRVASLPGSILAFDDDPADAPQPDTQEEQAATEDKENSPPEQEQEAPAEAGEEEETEEPDKDEEPGEKEDPEKDEPASEDDDPVFEVTLPDGKTEEVSVSALADGYLKAREAETVKAEAVDIRREYERRMQEIPTHVQQAVQHKENELAQAIQQWAQANPDIPAPSLEMLDPNSDSYNPDSYYRLKEQREIRERQAAQAAEQLKGIAEQRENQHREHEAREREKLKAAWPELVEDSAKQAAFIKQAEQHYGLTADDVRAFNDHRAFLVLRDAIGYREMKAEAPNVRQKVKAPRPKPVKANARKTQKERSKADLSEHRSRLKKTGRPEDAMAILERMDL